MGWKLFPVHSIENGRCSCGKPACESPGKHPRLKGGFTGATDDLLVIDGWLDRWPSMNIGLATGKPSMVVVLDVDEKNGVSGGQSLVSLEDTNDKLPPTLSQTTGGSGKHYFFKFPETTLSSNGNIPCSAGKIGRGLDIRADGGYVILPPSSHSSGIDYLWNNIDAPLLELPRWIEELAMEKNTLEVIRRKAKEIPEGTRNKRLFDLACAMRGKYTKEEFTDKDLLEWCIEYNEEHCSPPLDSIEVKTIAKQVARYNSNKSKKLARIVGGDPSDIERKMRSIVGEEDDDLLNYSELGNAFRFFVENDKDMRYCYPKKRWFIYDGTRWEEHHGGEPSLRMYRIVQKMKRELRDEDLGEMDKKILGRWIAKTQEKRTILSSISMAEPLMSIPVESMDKDPYDINLLNGTFNLETMKLREHDPKDHITFLAPIVYQKDAKCPIWLRHIDKVFDNDHKTIESFNRLCGYLLTETNPEQVMFIAFGGGKNGKSTTFNVISRILGDYSATAKAESFMKSNGVNDARNDLARLQRRRVVITSEPPAGGRLNETLIKSATGTDKISARFLYQEFVEFTPQFKIILHTNHRPKITESDEGIWRRLKMLPFNHIFGDDERDPKIEEKMMKESSGIFNWMIQGYKKYYGEEDRGLKESPAMKEAAASYRGFEDILANYIYDRCLMGPDKTVTKRELHSDFIEWCEINGDEPVAINKFSSRVADRFFTIKDTMINHVRSWKGIGLKEPMMKSVIKNAVQKRIGENK